MTRKTLIILLCALLLGAGAGVGGTLWAKTNIFKDSNKTISRSSADGLPVPIGDFTVNLQGGAYLKTTISVVGVDKSSEDTLKADDAYLKDRVNTVLANKTLADVQTPQAREKLRQELINQLNEVADNKIANVLFLAFVYQ